MALTAIPVGFFAGLFGIGGGLITVPFLFYVFSYFNLNQSYIMHLAVGTSFAIIIPTSYVSVYTHYKFNAVDFQLVKSYGLFFVCRFMDFCICFLLSGWRTCNKGIHAWHEFIYSSVFDTYSINYFYSWLATRMV